MRRRGGVGAAGAFVAAAAAVAASSLLAACTSSPAGTTGTRATTAPAASGPVWLCRPGLANDPCTANLAATVEPGPSPISSTTVQPNPPPTTPAIDCFYVYPTVSAQADHQRQPALDFRPKPVAEAQASPFAPHCRIFAPMYRQLTLGALEQPGGGPGIRVVGGAGLQRRAGRLAYYLAHDNAGRGVVFIGHSQGSSMLIRLLRSQVDPSPAERRLLVSAIILGGNVEVPVGQGVGGSFQNIPACNSTSATGCVVAYSSFSQTPPANSLFARAGTGVSLVSGQPPGPSRAFQVLCVNPTSLSSPATPGPLEPYFPTSTAAAAGKPSTPWVTYPNLYTAQCAYQDGASWLQVTDVAPTGDTRRW